MDDEFRSRIRSTYETTVLGWEKDPSLLRDCRQSIVQSDFYVEYMKRWYGTSNNNNNSDDENTGTLNNSGTNHIQQQQQRRRPLSTKHFMKHFVKYFQNNIMIWCNAPSCTYCSESNDTNDTTTPTPTTTTTMTSMGIRGPRTRNEKDGCAHRVEVYICTNCQTETTFPRYNNVQTLYSISAAATSTTPSSTTTTTTRVRRTPGRCGEYANLFGLYCRALGFETRYILDFTDHVWIEILVINDDDNDDDEYDDTTTGYNDRWCMLDSCEGVMDEYSMYEHGWKKKLSYCIAISSTAITDVTAKYTRQFHDPKFQARRRTTTTSEYNSRCIVQQMNTTISSSSSSSSSNGTTGSTAQQQQQLSKTRSKKEIDMMQQRYVNEDIYLQYLSTLSSWSQNSSSSSGNQNSNRHHLYQMGRISGSYQWKSSRNEIGNDHTNNHNHTTTRNECAATTNTTANNNAATMTIRERYPWLGNVETAYNTTPFLGNNTRNDGNSSNNNGTFEIYLKPPIAISNSRNVSNNDPSDVDDGNNDIDRCDSTTATIYINHVSCAMVMKQKKNQNHGLSIVVIDENFRGSSSSSYHSTTGGCILQSVICTCMSDVLHFLSSVPAKRIIVLVGTLLLPVDDDLVNSNEQEEEKLQQLFGTHCNLQQYINANDGIIYMGQILVQKQPNWSYCGSYAMTPHGVKFVLSSKHSIAPNDFVVAPAVCTDTRTENTDLVPPQIVVDQQQPVLQQGQEKFRLKTLHNVRPQSIIGRVPDAIMTLSEQLTTGNTTKRNAFMSFIKEQSQYLVPNNQQCCFGYTTKYGAPIYLLGPSSYPLVPCRQRYKNTNNKIKDSWNTFLLLPSMLVPENDCGICDDINTTGIKTENDNLLSTCTTPQYDIPIDQEFFQEEVGSQLLLPSMSTQDQCRIPTNDALHNSRLVAYYFSAHWCGPCRSFTPILAEMYTTLKEAYPSHGLEVIFVSSDRDEASFNQYFGTMPWLSIPYNQLHSYKAKLSTKYNVHGIPSLVVIDSISGQIVVPNTTSRALVMQTCQAGSDESIRTMFSTQWLSKTPPESQQLLDLLESSYADANSIVQEGDNSADEVPTVEFCPYLVRNEFMEQQEQIHAIVTQLIDDDSDMNETEAYVAATQAVELSLTDHDENTEAENCLDGLFDRIVMSETSPERYEVPLPSTISEQIVCSYGREQLVLVMTAIWKYVNNCYMEPWNPKYRKFQFSFKFADNFTKVTGSVQLLQSVGFEIYCTDEDFFAHIPIPTDLNQMKWSIATLCTLYDVEM